MPIDPQLLAVATPAELEQYERELMAEAALASPADYGEALASNGVRLKEYFERPPHVNLISETLVALIEGRLLKPHRDGCHGAISLVAVDGQLGQVRCDTAGCSGGKPYRKLMIAMPPRH